MANTLTKAENFDGRIIGYTDIGLNEGHDDLALTTSYVVATDEFSVTYIVPQSGNVLIEFQIQLTYGSSGLGNLSAGLSTANATSGYSALVGYNEKVFDDVGTRNGINTVHGKWTLTGITAGTVGATTERWIGFKSTSTIGSPTIRWGANSVDRYPDFIMKATALPVSITT